MFATSLGPDDACFVAGANWEKNSGIMCVGPALRRAEGDHRGLEGGRVRLRHYWKAHLALRPPHAHPPLRWWPEVGLPLSAWPPSLARYPTTSCPTGKGTQLVLSPSLLGCGAAPDAQHAAAA